MCLRHDNLLYVCDVVTLVNDDVTVKGDSGYYRCEFMLGTSSEDFVISRSFYLNGKRGVLRAAAEKVGGCMHSYCLFTQCILLIILLVTYK